MTHLNNMNHKSDVSRRRFLKLSLMAGVAASAAVSTPSFAKDTIYTSFFSNNAAGGYDVVSYFQTGGPTEGSKAFSTEHEGATWLFSSQENLDLFKGNPAMYAPQYGGYCAYAVATGTTAKGDPLQWHVENDKLYLNINKSIRTKWLSDIDGYIKRGDDNWPKVIN